MYCFALCIFFEYNNLCFIKGLITKGLSRFRLSKGLNSEVKKSVRSENESLEKIRLLQMKGCFDHISYMLKIVSKFSLPLQN